MHPYQQLEPFAHWRNAIGNRSGHEIDPVVNFKFKLNKNDKIATAGSCFAQHIARYLIKSGYNYYVTEPGHPILTRETREKFGYGLFSARYGNIYTSRQLVQMFDRAYGTFCPLETVWRKDQGRLVDPFRPTVQPEGFASEKEFWIDRTRHLAAVRQMFESLDVFIFTLGLTETWADVRDGAVFPLCPGVVAGSFDPERHQFVNLSVEAVVADLEGFVERLDRVNPQARVILTVSPVPLMATAEPRHVLVSTTVSKAVLRAAADVVERRQPRVAYFPSYEIITGSFSRGRYFAPDLRTVTEEGVQHVMTLFLGHATEGGILSTDAPPDGPTPASQQEEDRFLEEAKKVVDVICDEEAIKYQDGDVKTAATTNKPVLPFAPLASDLASYRLVTGNLFKMLSQMPFHRAFGCVEVVERFEDKLRIAGWAYYDGLRREGVKLICIAFNGAVSTESRVISREDVQGIMNFDRADIGFEFYIDGANITSFSSSLVVLLVENNGERVFKVPFLDGLIG